MKKIYYFLMATFVAVCMCAACSSGDEPINDGNSDNGGNGGNDVENGSTTAASIVGKWKWVAYEGFDSTMGEWNEVYDDPDEYGGFIFNEDGTGLDFVYCDGEIDGFAIEWTLSGEKLKIVFEDLGEYAEDEYDVEELTSTKLVIVEYWSSPDGSDKEMEKYTYQRVE